MDWWSLGTLLYEMLCGLPPFYDTNIQRMYNKILQAPLRLPSHLSEPAKDILTGLLQRKVEDRIGSGSTDAEELKATSFFAVLDFDRVYKREYQPEFVPPAMYVHLHAFFVSFSRVVAKVSRNFCFCCSTGMQAKRDGRRQLRRRVHAGAGRRLCGDHFDVGGPTGQLRRLHLPRRRHGEPLVRGRGFAGPQPSTMNKAKPLTQPRPAPWRCIHPFIHSGQFPCHAFQPSCLGGQFLCGAVVSLSASIARLCSPLGVVCGERHPRQQATV